VLAAPSSEQLLPVLASWLGLTPRQRELANLLEKGLAVKQAARRLGLSRAGVEDHLKHLYRSAGVHSRDELVAVLTGSL
jgi:DNA-binding CsgD family transcriptional regulator